MNDPFGLAADIAAMTESTYPGSTQLRDRPLQPVISRAELDAGELRANTFQAKLEARAKAEWDALATIAIEWLTDMHESFEAWQILWLSDADRRARLWTLERDYIAYRCAKYGVGEQIEIEREIEAEMSE